MREKPDGRRPGRARQPAGTRSRLISHGCCPREPIRAQRHSLTQETVVRRTEHVLVEPRSPGLGVQGGGLLVGDRGDQGQLVLLGEFDRPVEEPFRFAVLPRALAHAPWIRA